MLAKNDERCSRHVLGDAGLARHDRSWWSGHEGCDLCHSLAVLRALIIIIIIIIIVVIIIVDSDSAAMPPQPV